MWSKKTLSTGAVTTNEKKRVVMNVFGTKIVVDAHPDIKGRNILKQVWANHWQNYKTKKTLTTTNTKLDGLPKLSITEKNLLFSQ